MQRTILTTEHKREVPNLIREFFDDQMIKTLFYHACRVDVADNNDKAEMIKLLLPWEEFDELGTGTNRITFLHNGFAIKIALDRRGLVDNFAEYKRSAELPMYLAKTYETNMLINVAEYVNMMDQREFQQNEVTIKQILTNLSKRYIFNDVGFSLKNSCNWGFRNSTEIGEFDIVILDYGYLYPLRGQDNDLFVCPKCGGRIKWNANFTELHCNNPQCGMKYSPLQIRNRMSRDFEEVEDQIITKLNDVDMPNLSTIEAESNPNLIKSIY